MSKADTHASPETAPKPSSLEITLQKMVGPFSREQTRAYNAGAIIAIKMGERYKHNTTSWMPERFEDACDQMHEYIMQGCGGKTFPWIAAFLDKPENREQATLLRTEVLTRYSFYKHLKMVLRSVDSAAYVKKEPKA